MFDINELQASVIELLKGEKNQEAFDLYLNESKELIKNGNLTDEQVFSYVDLAMLMLWSNKYKENGYKIKEVIRQLFFNSLMEYRLKILFLKSVFSGLKFYFSEELEYDFYFGYIEKTFGCETKPVVLLRDSLSCHFANADKNENLYQNLVDAIATAKRTSANLLEDGDGDYEQDLEMSRLCMLTVFSSVSYGYAMEYYDIDLLDYGFIFLLKALGKEHPLLQKPMLDYYNYVNTPKRSSRKDLVVDWIK